MRLDRRTGRGTGSLDAAYGGRMGTSQVAVRELAVRFQSQCGPGSIPAMCCILPWMSHSALDREGTRPCPAPKVRARGACTQSDTSSRALHILECHGLAGSTDDVSETLTAATMPAVYCGCGQDEHRENTTVAARMFTRPRWYLEEGGAPVQG